jgi:hypothetical protein
MSDRFDTRARELVYRMMAMAPDAPPFPEEANAMNVPEPTRPRSPILVWVAAAAAVVLLVGVPLILFRGGEPSGPASTIAAPTSTAPTSSTPDSTTTAPPAADQQVSYSVYVFSGELQTAIGDPALVPVFHTMFMGPDAVADDAVVAAALNDLVELRPDGGYSTSIPAGVVVNSVTVADGVATVDLSSGFESGGGTMAMTTRLAQVVYTATQFPAVDSVLFSIDGESVEAFSSEGIVLDGPQTRDDYVDILPQIFLDQPAIGSTVGSGVTLRGIANVFEATVSYEIVDSAGTVLADGVTNATCGTGCWGEFAQPVTFALSEETEGAVIAYESSARDGSRINELRYPVTLLPSAAETTDTTVPSTTVPETISTTSLPGEAFDLGPRAGDVVAVIGVAHDDVLNLRNGPGTGYEIIATLDPLADDLVATGRHRLLTSSIWSEVEANGVVGWVNQSYLAYLGAVHDDTAYVVDRLGAVPQAETMVDLGTLVADQYASVEPTSDVVMSVAPTVGDLGEITYDVVGVGDDAQVGVRLHVFGAPTAGGEGFSLQSVEATALCGRGVTADGLCV